MIMGIIQLMKEVKFKFRKPDRGNSEFTRSKLEAEYDPKVRFIKHNVMSLQEIPERDRHEYIAKEEHDVCDRAIRQIKGGGNLVIDWNTRSNFRVTRSILPKLKTQPTDSLLPPPNRYLSLSPLSANPIETKRFQLAQLLHQRHKKKYMQTKSELQQEKRLFGDDKSTGRQSKDSSGLNSYMKHSRVATLQHSRKTILTKEDSKIEDVQEEILNTSKLQILKDELRAKFIEIRQIYYQNNSKPKTKNRQNSFFQE